MSSPHAMPDKGPHEKGTRGGSRRGRVRRNGGDATEQLIFTLSKATGAVTKIEKIDADGKRHEIPKDETIALAGKNNFEEIEEALDEAFEAGISSVLEPGERPKAEAETEEDMELRRMLLSQIIGRDLRRRLQSRLVQRLILSRTLMH